MAKRPRKRSLLGQQRARAHASEAELVAERDGASAPAPPTHPGEEVEGADSAGGLDAPPLPGAAPARAAPPVGADEAGRDDTDAVSAVPGAPPEPPRDEITAPPPRTPLPARRVGPPPPPVGVPHPSLDPTPPAARPRGPGQYSAPRYRSALEMGRGHVPLPPPEPLLQGYEPHLLGGMAALALGFLLTGVGGLFGLWLAMGGRLFSALGTALGGA